MSPAEEFGNQLTAMADAALLWTVADSCAAIQQRETAALAASSA
jgi:hypothetical protein